MPLLREQLSKYRIWGCCGWSYRSMRPLRCYIVINGQGMSTCTKRWLW